MKNLEMFDTVVEEYVASQLKELCEEVAEMQSRRCPVAEVAYKVNEVNKLIAIIAGKNEDLYRRTEFHLFSQMDGKIMIVQGKEINVGVFSDKITDSLEDE